jgi:hypothetical protein
VALEIEAADGVRFFFTFSMPAFAVNKIEVSQQFFARGRDIIPVMTSNTNPPPFVIFGDREGLTAWRLVDRTTSVISIGWFNPVSGVTGLTGTGQWRVDLGASTFVSSFMYVSAGSGFWDLAPKDFTLLGSNDGTIFTPVFEMQDVGMVTTPFVEFPYTLPSPVSYRHYELRITRIHRLAGTNVQSQLSAFQLFS